MLASILIILFSSALLVYWFRYTCILLVRNGTEEVRNFNPAAQSSFSFGEIQNRLRSEAQLDPLATALQRDYQVEIDPGEARRNIVTRGVPLNQLVGREFEVGATRLRGTRLCEPCSHLEGLTRKGVVRGLVHRGGLRADILAEGTIRVGDDIHLI